MKDKSEELEKRIKAKLGGPVISELRTRAERLCELLDADDIVGAHELADRLATDLVIERVKRRSSKEIRAAMEMLTPPNIVTLRTKRED